MRIFDMLRLVVPELEPAQTNLHLAGHNGLEDPLDVFLAGNFPAWQMTQNQKNFERPYVLSLIKMAERDRWLFAGAHRVLGSATWGPDVWVEMGECWNYPLEEMENASQLTGRLVAHFTRPGRNSYLNAENWVEQVTLAEVYPRRLSIGDFPGYRSVALTFDELRLVTQQGLPSWRAALANVGGVYLISDTETGKLFVGSAAGAGGLWQRWNDYAVTGHGGNVELRAIINGQGRDRARPFRFSILEIADVHTGEADVLARESHWKRLLLSREHGLNSN
jgi:hypothetical protein